MKSNNTKQNEVDELRKISSENIKAYRRMIGLTQAALSEQIGLDHQAVGRYERMECSVSRSSAKALCGLSGYIEEHWLGITKAKTCEAFLEECADKGLEDYERERQAIERKRKNVSSIVSACGFGYKDFSAPENLLAIEFSPDADSAEYVRVSGGRYDVPNRITDYSRKYFAEPVYLSNEELYSLSQAITDLIGYTCYKKTIDTKGE